MKRKILATVALACLFAYAPQPVHAAAIDDAAFKIIDQISSNPQAKDTVCRQGAAANVLSGKAPVISIRAFNGGFADLPVVGEVLSAVGEVICKDVAGYNGSKFNVKAVAKLKALKASGKITAGDENPSQALAEILARRSKQLQTKVCGGAAAAAGPLAQVCSVSQKLVASPAA